jgi:hypothetical protein
MTRSARRFAAQGPASAFINNATPAVRLGTHERATRTVQAKLSVSHPGDRFEQEADRVAEQVMRMPAGHERGPASVVAAPPALSIQRRPACNSDAGLSVGQDLLPSLGGGQPLDSSTSRFFESRFGSDLSGVRLHTDRGAAESARALNARAYTLGNNVVFAQGEYQPHTEAGRHLLAHELAHTLQQGGGASPSIQRKIGVGLGLKLDTQGFNTTEKDGVYTCPAVVKNSVWNEIFTSLLFSPREFEVAGSTNAELNSNFQKHMAARYNIVEFASKKKYGFAAGAGFTMNPDFWIVDHAAGTFYPKPGVERQKAVQDLNVHPEKYAIACEAATALTMEGGGRSPVTADNGVGVDDWIPGDWGYIRNTKFPPVGGQAGLEGENLIYTGKDKFWGHFGPGIEYKTLQEWFNQVKGWHGGARAETWRKRPTVGLL